MSPKPIATVYGLTLGQPLLADTLGCATRSKNLRSCTASPDIAPAYLRPLQLLLDQDNVLLAVEARSAFGTLQQCEHQRRKLEQHLENRYGESVAVFIDHWDFSGVVWEQELAHVDFPIRGLSLSQCSRKQQEFRFEIAWGAGRDELAH